LIGEVRGCGRTEGKRVDEVRLKVRVGNKKKKAIVLTAEQAWQVKTQHPPTSQGSCDRLLIGLLLDLGLRASEVAALTVEDLSDCLLAEDRHDWPHGINDRFAAGPGSVPTPSTSQR
jgi:integrase